MFVDGGSAAPAGRGSRRPLVEADELAALAARARPVSAAASRVLPVLEGLSPLLPSGLRRGSTVLLTGAAGGGATSLAASLLVGASRAGGWCALVGLADPGIVALAELGLELTRVALVPRPGGAWAEAAGHLLGGVDAVLLALPGRARPTVGRHLSARARERGSALLVLAARATDWPEAPDLTLRVGAADWHGMGEGHGHLRGRRTEVEVTGRRGADRAVAHTVWLPSATGHVSTAAAPRGRGAAS